MSILQTSKFLSIEAIHDLDGAIQITNYVRHSSYRVSVKYWDLLIFSRTGKSENELRSFLSSHLGLTHEQQSEAIDVGRDRYFLVTPDDPVEQRSLLERDRWERYSWNEAFWLHASTRNYQFIDYAGKEGPEEDFSMMANYLAETGPPPAIAKSYDGPFIKLPNHWPELGKNQKLARLLCGFEDNDSNFEKHSIDDLGAFLFFSVGKLGTISFRAQGDFLLKPVPSGGARHPTEVYIIVTDIRDVQRGVYHYDVLLHGLRLIRPLDGGTNTEEFLRALIVDFGDRITKAPSFVAVVTSRVERAQWRYRDPRSHRAVLFDIGHVLGQFRVIASALKMSPFITQGVREEELERLFKISRDEEVITHAVLI